MRTAGHIARQYAALYQVALGTGVRMIRRAPLLGTKRLLLPLSYWRMAEFGYVSRMLPGAQGMRVLDVGSPKELAFFLARMRGYSVTATDIQPGEVERSSAYASALQVNGVGPGKVISQVQDGRCLRYDDDSFDAAFSVSVLEHIPDDGDSQAIAELVRVVKPGGRVVITTPYAPRYRETFLEQSVYERERTGTEPVFFERHYDEATLSVRLLDPSGARLIDRELWGEGRIRMERLLASSPLFRTLLSPLEPALSLAFLRRLHVQEGHPMAVFFTLEVKPR